MPVSGADGRSGTGRARSALRNIALAFAATAVAFAAVELALRLFTDPAFEQRNFPKVHWLTKDPTLGWENRRGYANFNFSINSLGFRGPEFPKRKADGSVRIVTLGDSSTFGLRVTDDTDLSSREALRFDNYPEELARRFEGRRESRIEVINAGVVGYTSAHGLRQLVTRIAGLSPDIVTVRFGFNDHKMIFDDTTRPQESASPFRRQLLYALHEWRLVRLAVAAYNGYGAAKARKHSRASVTPEEFERNLRRIAEVSRERGFRVLFLDYPLRPVSWGFHPKHAKIVQRSGHASLADMLRVHRRYHEALRRVAEAEGVPLLATGDRFRAADAPLFGTADMVHPTAEGMRELARMIDEKLTDLGWIPPPESG